MTVIISLMRSIYYLLSLKLTFPKTYTGKELQTEDGLKFKIFRHMKLNVKKKSGMESILVVRFKFKKFSHKINMRLSGIPILLIAGFPGFKDKLWMIDRQTGYWQGLYQWDNEESIENYKKSFVLGIMNRRALNNTIEYNTIPGKNIDEYLQDHLIK